MDMNLEWQKLEQSQLLGSEDKQKNSAFGKSELRVSEVQF